MRRFAVVVALVLGACSPGHSATPRASVPTRPASTASVRILAPTNGQVIRGKVVRVRVQLTGGKIVPLASKNLKPNEGHVHVKLDGLLRSMTAGLAVELRDVKPGNHLLQVEFVASDHAPFEPRVLAAVTFTTR